jgi:hypothetical protein
LCQRPTAAAFKDEQIPVLPIGQKRRKKDNCPHDHPVKSAGILIERTGKTETKKQKKQTQTINKNRTYV